MVNMTKPVKKKYIVFSKVKGNTESPSEDWLQVDTVMQKYLYWRVSITGESLFKPAGDLAVDLAPLSIQECSSEDLSVCLSKFKKKKIRSRIVSMKKNTFQEPGFQKKS